MTIISTRLTLLMSTVALQATHLKTIRYLLKIALFLLLASLTITASAQSLTGESTRSKSTGWITNPDHPAVQVRFMLTGEVDRTSNTLPAVLEVKLADDWKTYWRTPGEGGIAPSIDWQQSTNLHNIEWYWPTPEEFSLLGMQTFGYQGYASFPLRLELKDLNQQLKLIGKLTLSSCTNICVLTDYEVTLAVSPSNLTLDAQAMFIFNKAMATVPLKVDADASSDVSIGWDANSKLLEVVIDRVDGSSPKLIIDGEPDVVFSLRDVKQNNGKLTATFSATSWLGEPELIGKQLNLVLANEFNAKEFTVVVHEKVITADETPLLKMLLIALIGGLILNVMPCVLPVLAMKLNSVIAAPTIQQGQIRKQFIASALGILASFWLIASFILILKFSGQAIGWGIQFQNPWFIAFMVVVTALFALNMLGAFEIQISSNLQTRIATSRTEGYSSHFFQGMFATLLATPCSAPFLGTAVAFALAADVISLFIIFTALAMGMALPWILIALFPKLVKFLPKPGQWMNVAKVILSALLLLTCIWLISLLANFIPLGYALMTGLVFTLLYFVFLAKLHGKRAVVAMFSFSTIALAVTTFVTIDQWSRPLPTDLTWRSLNKSFIDQQVNEGKTVFVDVTADWCITCKANKAGVILQDPVYSILKTEQVIAVQGDWTKPAEHITQYLQSNNQFGVPFNMVYGPNAPNGIELPVILSTQAVLGAIEAASAVRQPAD